MSRIKLLKILKYMIKYSSQKSTDFTYENRLNCVKTYSDRVISAFIFEKYIPFHSLYSLHCSRKRRSSLSHSISQPPCFGTLTHKFRWNLQSVWNECVTSAKYTKWPMWFLRWQWRSNEKFKNFALLKSIWTKKD